MPSDQMDMMEERKKNRGMSLLLLMKIETVWSIMCMIKNRS